MFLKSHRNIPQLFPDWIGITGSWKTCTKLVKIYSSLFTTITTQEKSAKSSVIIWKKSKEMIANDWEAWENVVQNVNVLVLVESKQCRSILGKHEGKSSKHNKLSVTWNSIFRSWSSWGRDTGQFLRAWDQKRDLMPGQVFIWNWSIWLNCRFSFRSWRFRDCLRKNFSTWKAPGIWTHSLRGRWGQNSHKI